MAGCRREQAPRRWATGGDRRISARLARLVDTGDGAVIVFRRGTVRFYAGHAETPFVVFIHAFRFCVDKTLHAILGTSMSCVVTILVLRDKAAHT